MYINQLYPSLHFKHCAVFDKGDGAGDRGSVSHERNKSRYMRAFLRVGSGGRVKLASG